MFVFIIFSGIFGLAATNDASLASVVFVFLPFSRSSETPGIDRFPRSELVRYHLFDQPGGMAYFTATLYIYRAFPYPQLGDAPDGMLMPPEGENPLIPRALQNHLILIID